jgi:hypothetical protein
MHTPEEIAFKRRQLASLREAHPDPAPHVAEAIARLERETAEAPTADTTVADQLTAAQSIIAGLEAEVAKLRDHIAELEANLSAERVKNTKPKTTPKRKR